MHVTQDGPVLFSNKAIIPRCVYECGVRGGGFEGGDW